MNQSVILFINIVLLLIGLGLMFPIATLFIECSAALLSNRTKTENDGTPRPKIAVLVPAHNEASGISITLKTLLPQLTNQDRLVVIADNCSDETAAIARQSGVTVIERHDSECRGKGYALDFGLKFIAAEPPEVVVTVDADCIVHQGTVDQIARLAAASRRPVQSTYLMAQPANPTPKDSVSALAFLVKNLVRPSGLTRLGLPCLLTGTGMAFPWSVIQTAPIASANIVEDMQLSLDLAIAGKAPLFCPAAKVTGYLPQQKQAAKSQRTRWEHGHLQTLLTQVPRLLKASIIQKRFDLLTIALDLCVPPLSLLVMMWIIAMGGGLLVGIWAGKWVPSILIAIEGIMIFLSIFQAWLKFGREHIPGLNFLAVPIYMFWKLPLYLSFLVQRQTKWIRTERDMVNFPEKY
ncbi:MAG: glycosyltransferase family 2 protein [Nostocaceae cyanobacterium]|nr:glycosyltransferase family 2 protein [Nostocaceae cyanobacterium]